MEVEIRKYNSVESTNLLAREHLSDLVPGKIIAISASNQFAGRGYGTNKWESENGKNLLASILIKPDFLSASEQFVVSIITSLSLLDVLKQIAKVDGFSIKWPNDLYFKNFKLGGILIENSISGNKIANSIIGVGLNLNQVGFSDNLPNPTSLKLISGMSHDIDEVLLRFVEKFNQFTAEAEIMGFVHVKSLYVNNLYGLNVSRDFMADGQKFKGTIRDIDEFGRLLIEVNSEYKYFGFKEVEYLFELK